jgi:hypothetical protein
MVYKDQVWLKNHGTIIETFDNRASFKWHEKYLVNLAHQNGREIAYTLVPFKKGSIHASQWQVYLLNKGETL